MVNLSLSGVCSKYWLYGTAPNGRDNPVCQAAKTAEIAERDELTIAAGAIRKQLISILKAFLSFTDQLGRTGQATREGSLLTDADPFDAGPRRLIVTEARARETGVGSFVNQGLSQMPGGG